jgi:peptidoglycan/LPS O-acetylase OafA/YrhL
MGPETNARPQRDPYVDWLRAVSLLVVVVWHWAFTILTWGPRGPHATNPLGFTSGLWVITWLLQVLPVFFYVGGHVHRLSWERAATRGEPARRYVWRHVKQLLVPAGALVLAWVALGTVLGQLFDLRWIGGAVKLVISPLWFLGVYLVLIVLLPAALWVHRRLDVLALVLLAGAAVVVDVLRFRYGLEAVGLVNLLVVWGLAHQLGFFHERIVAARRQTSLALMIGGLLGLIGLVSSGLYPGSMVGVPGNRLSNMAPPTVVIVALLAFQVGVAEVTRPAVTRLLQRRRWARFSQTLNRFALPLFLFHTTGMALARGMEYLLLRGRVVNDRTPDLIWWLERPLAVAGPLLLTVPLIAVFGRRWVQRPQEPASGPVAARA